MSRIVYCEGYKVQEPFQTGYWIVLRKPAIREFQGVAESSDKDTYVFFMEGGV